MGRADFAQFFKHKSCTSWIKSNSCPWRKCRCSLRFHKLFENTKELLLFLEKKKKITGLGFFQLTKLYGSVQIFNKTAYYNTEMKKSFLLKSFKAEKKYSFHKLHSGLKFFHDRMIGFFCSQDGLQFLLSVFENGFVFVSSRTERVVCFSLRLMLLC